ncbi:MAG: hypothetical protein ASARMPREDX12_000878 [Alectoria sarmentosa]|nr:MAG: hypothetical protein ASARMPREDX12_000878 [Alectoria sarmentosa]
MELEEIFVGREYIVLKSSISIDLSRKTQEPWEDYNEALPPMHESVSSPIYMMSNRSDFWPWKTSTTFSKVFSLFTDRTGIIIELLRYIYAITGESVPGIGDLRKPMTEYIGYKMDTLMKDESSKDLMIADGSALLEDFMSMVKKWI